MPGEHELSAAKNRRSRKCPAEAGAFPAFLLQTEAFCIFRLPGPGRSGIISVRNRLVRLRGGR